MDLLKETVDAVVNSRFPEMSKEGRELLAEVLIRRESNKGEIVLNEGQVSHNLIFVGKGMLRQFYYKNGKDVTEHFSYEGCIVMCIESLLKQEPTRLIVEALEQSTLFLQCVAKIGRNITGNQYVLSKDTGIFSYRFTGKGRFLAL